MKYSTTNFIHLIASLEKRTDEDLIEVIDMIYARWPADVPKDKPESKRFVAPKEKDVYEQIMVKWPEHKQHAQSMAANFWNFYESKGWMIGKSPMKKWVAALSRAVSEGWLMRTQQYQQVPAQPNNMNKLPDYLSKA